MAVRQPTHRVMYTINLVVDEEVAKHFAARGHRREMEEGPAMSLKGKWSQWNDEERPRFLTG